MTETFAKRLEVFQETHLHDLLCDFVRIPSISGEERKILEYAGEYLTSNGLEVEIHSLEPEYPNVISTLGSGDGQVIVLNGHLDTVPPAALEQWDSDPFEPVTKNGRVYGLGAFDMKGSVAAMILAFRVLHEFADHLGATIQLQLVSDEDGNAVYGTPYLMDMVEKGKLPRPDHVIVGEFTGLKVMTGERGSFKFLVHLVGRATHTATARVDGRNAIFAAAEVVRLLERDLVEIEHPEVGRAVISVNQIWGGSHLSQVPDQCTIQVDRRMIPGETMESVLSQAEKQIERLREKIPWLEFEVTPLLNAKDKPFYLPPNVSPRDTASANALREAHQFVAGVPAEDFRGWFGASDARCFRYAGIDAVNYGPIGAGAHGPNEYVVLDSLKTQLAVVAYALADLGGIDRNLLT